MARRPRICIAGYPHHIVQRGHNRRAVFFGPADFEYYLANLIKFKSQYDVAVYAWCLMTNHVHLVLCPRTEGSAISALMRRVAARQSRYVNRTMGRSGTLWEGRFKCSIVDTDAYLLACMRYVELNPVRAGICRHPMDYRWSSYAHKVGRPMEGRDDMWLNPDPVTETLGKNQAARQRAYAQFVEGEIAPAEHEFIRTAVHRNQLTGDAGFIDAINRRTGQRIESRGPGRPSQRSDVKK